MSKTYILVSGGSGYIGSHTCKRLAEKGYIPVVVDYKPRPEFLRWGPYIGASISDVEQVGALISQYNIKVCIHFAALISVSESVSNPQLYYENNVRDSLCFFETLRVNGVDKLVFSSTAAVYGDPGLPDISEACPKQPINPYGHGKAFIETVLQDYSHAYGFSSVSFRYFNASGADPDAEIGEAHDPETHLIPLILDAAMGRRDAISIFGHDYDTPDGTCVRDYIHVFDLADAHIHAVDYLLNGGATDVFNLGTGQGYSVKQVIDMASQVTGLNIPIHSASRRLGDPAYLVANVDKVKRQFGWTARYSELEQIISDAWRWHRKQ